MAVSPQAPGKPEKSLAVFDIDGTVLDFFDTMRRVVEPFHEKLATSRGMTVPELRQKIQETAQRAYEESGGKNDQFGIVLNSPAKIIDVMAFLQPRQEGDDLLAHDLRRDFAKEMQLFPDVANSFAEMTLDQDGQRNGVNIAFLTDGQRSAVVQRLALCAKKADESGVLPAGVKFMDLVDRVYTQPDAPGISAIEAAIPTADPALRPYLEEIAAKTEALPANTHKPGPNGLIKVMDDFGRTPEETIMVGDTVNDGGAAKNCPGVEFVWQRQGADVPPATVQMQHEIQPSYVVGIEATKAKMDAAGVTPDVVADRGIQTLLDAYEFKSDRAHADTPKFDAVTADRSLASRAPRTRATMSA